MTTWDSATDRIVARWWRQNLQKARMPCPANGGFLHISGKQGPSRQAGRERPRAIKA